MALGPGTRLGGYEALTLVGVASALLEDGVVSPIRLILNSKPPL